MLKIIRLIICKTLQAVLLLLGVSLLVFMLLTIAGGDALTALRGNGAITEEGMAEWRHIYGLDQPLLIRYGRWLRELVTGRLGYSCYFQAPVSSIIWPRLLHTCALAGVAMTISLTFSLTVGIAAALRRNGWMDRLCDLIVLMSASIPRLVLAMTALTLIAPIAWSGVGESPDRLTVSLWFLRILPPALILCVPLVSHFLPQTRTSVSLALDQDFVRVARAKGLPETTILFRHVLRPALTPLLTIFGYAFGGVMSGSVVVERVMGWPGLGALSVTAVQSRDLPLLLGVVVVTAISVFVGNLLADILLRLNDPRLR
jgi:peptide/nickel transport system permease protein